jgi:hypothetical protein
MARITFEPHPLTEWFFPLISVRTIRFFRISLGFITLASVSLWFAQLTAWFTSEGYITRDYALTLASNLAKPSLFFWYDAPWFVYACFFVMVASCLALMWGKGGRIAAFLVWLLFVSFTSRAVFVYYGGVDILLTLLFFNIFHPATGYQPWGHGGKAERERSVPAWNIRMVQLFLCYVYFFAAMSKVRYESWYNGSELMNTLQTRYGVTDFSWLQNSPLIIALMTYFSWMSELSFGFLVWGKQTRRLALVLIVGMHVGIWLMVNATFFSPIMFVALSVFLVPDDWRLGKELATRIRQRLPLAPRALKRAA